MVGYTTGTYGVLGTAVSISFVQQALFGAFGPSASVEVILTNVGGRASRATESSTNGAGASTLTHFIYSSGENVEGEVRVIVPPGKKIEHIGIKVELKGVVELATDRSVHEFTSLVKELAGPGVLTSSQVYKFAFPAVEMRNETYEGIHALCRYFVRATVSRSGYSVTNIVKELDFLVQNVEKPPTGDTSVTLEVGIEDCLHIEFEYDKTQLHLTDVLTGRVNFMLVRIKIKFMELAIIRRETAAGKHENETLIRFEVMDGCPARGERIPLRLFLSGVPSLTPTLANVNNAFSVKYFVNLVLVDEEDRRYFKQQELLLWRNQLTTA